MINLRLRSVLLIFTLNSLPFGMCLRQKPSSRFTTSSCLLCRGGQQRSPSQNPYYNTNDNYDPYAATSFNPPPMGAKQDAEHIFQETVQDRVDKWRSDQMQQRQQRSAAEEADLRDSTGRVKLMATVGKGSRAIIFFLLMWRDIHLFEVADNSLKGGMRIFGVVPLTVLFIANLAGVIFSLSIAGPATKKRLKAILNLDKMLEIVLIMWYFLRLTVYPSKYVPREIYIASMLHSVFFIIQCQSFTRITWDEKLAAPLASIPTEAEDVQYQNRYRNPQQQQQAYHNSYSAQNASPAM